MSSLSILDRSLSWVELLKVNVFVWFDLFGGICVCIGTEIRSFIQFVGQVDWFLFSSFRLKFVVFTSQFFLVSQSIMC